MFRLHPISKSSLAVLLAIAATFLLPAGAVWFAPDLPRAQKLTGSILLLAISAPFLWFAVRQRLSSLAITPDRVILEIPVFGRAIALDRLIPQSLSRLTMKEPQGYRLRWRTFGLSVPGYQLGWFRTAGEGRVLAAITANDLIAFKTVDDFSVVVSAQDCDGLMVMLRDRLRTPDAPSGPPLSMGAPAGQ